MQVKFLRSHQQLEVSQIIQRPIFPNGFINFTVVQPKKYIKLPLLLEDR